MTEIEKGQLKKISRKPQQVNADTLTIYYRTDLKRSILQPEYFRGIKSEEAAHKIISQRNAPNIKKVLYGGKPLDISNHIKLYPTQTHHE